MTHPPPSSTDHAFLAGGGELGRLMRAHDWRATPLGPLEGWPQSLRSAVSIMLNSRYPIALYWGPELALLYNDAWSPIPGGKHPWALGRPGREVWPEIWDTIGPLYARVFETGEGVWQEDELLPMNRHGYVEECYYNFTFSPVRGEDGGIDGIFNAVVETTDRVLSERRLRTLSRMGERADASQSVGDACRWAADILGDNRTDVPFAMIYLRAGDHARLAAASGIDAGSAGAPPIVDLDDASAPWVLRAVDGGDIAVVPAPVSFALPHGPWVEPIAEAVLAPIAVAGEARPVAFLVAGANPRRRMDASYRSFFTLAAGHVATAIATARAYEEERRRAEALAEIDRAKTQFFSNVSHEFRTPLTLMLWPLEDVLAEARALPPEQRERLDLAHRNALRLLRLVNALLDFSRIEAGRVDARFQPTDLAALTADLASAFRAATEKAGLTLEVDAPRLPQPVYVDRTIWETIVLNLLSNAFKFTFEGRIGVAVREGDGVAELIVSDTGTGIPDSELPRLFERFHRVEGARGRSFEGSGIGLALVQELVQQHGGTITVQSEVGRGTRFSVAVPLGSAHLPAERVDDAAAPHAVGRAQSFVEEAIRWLPDVSAKSTPETGVVAGVGTSVGAGERILVADDNADLRGYIARLLAERGYVVEAVGDGAVALAAARARRPDLVITDVMMPTLDGFGLLAGIRGDAALRDLPVVMLSARAGDEARIEGLDAGVDDYLVKPFAARELLARVASHLALARVRRAAADAVRASEARASGVLDGMAEGFLLLDADFRILDVNSEALRLERKSRDDVVGRLHWEVWPNVHDTKLGAALRRAMRDRAPFEMENHYVWPDGREGWFDVRAYPANGGLSIFYRDVTDRKRAEARLRESEEQLRLATDAAEVGLWDVDEVQGRLFWPPLVKAMFGISADVPVTMRDFYDGLHPEDREATSAAYAAAADPARRAVYDVEYRTIGREDGVVRWVAAKGRGVFDDDGCCLRVIGTAIDITARRAVELRLLELNATLEQRVAEQTRERDRIWRLSRDPLLVADEQGRWVSMSPVWTELLGWTEEELLGRTSEWMEHPDDRARTRDEVIHLARGGRTLRFENRFRTKGGEYRWFSWTAVPDGGLLYATARDVTEEKARQSELEAAQDALRQAQKMEAVGQLTGGIAHDFNNLLQGVAGSLDLIRRKPGDRERVQRWAEAGFKAAERGAKLTGQLLAFSRSQKIELKPVVLSDLVSGFRDMLDRTIGAHIEVALDLRTDGVCVLGDEVQIEMAVLNLALNARDAMPEGGALTLSTRAVRVSNDRELADGDYVELAVRDTGTGMPAEVAARAFDPFFTTKGVGKGTGLGLSQVYGAMRQAGGTVRIESSPGRGTTVRMLLRRTEDSRAAARGEAGAAGQGGFSARILIVDDDADVRRFLMESLDALGFAVIEAEDGAAGLAAVERSGPDLMILDFAMPGLNGAEVAKRVQETRPDLPIIFATGFADSAAIEAVAAANTPILRKPFGLDELQRVLNMALQQSEGAVLSH